MSKPFFSVIIPSFNRGYCLDRAISSVFQQTYKNYELIVVNDGSSDGTDVFLKSLAKIKVINTGTPGKPIGVSRARNKAVQEAKGEWLCFLDSDDEWLPKKLELQKNYIEQYPETQIVHGEERWIRRGVRVNPMKKHQKSGGKIFLNCLNLCLISPSTVAIKRETFDKVGGFREDFPVCEDYDLWLKITSLMPVGFVEDELIIKYGGHEDQLSRKYHSMDYYRVKSLDWVLQNRQLSEEERKEVRKVIQEKAEILLKGFKKHGNMDSFPEVSTISTRWAP